MQNDFHLIAPDYPGFGQSESPARDVFAYTFDHLAEIMDAFLRDVPDAKIVLVESGHFALENRCAEISAEIRSFFAA